MEGTSVMVEVVGSAAWKVIILVKNCNFRSLGIDYGSYLSPQRRLPLMQGTDWVGEGGWGQKSTLYPEILTRCFARGGREGEEVIFYFRFDHRTSLELKLLVKELRIFLTLDLITWKSPPSLRNWNFSWRPLILRRLYCILEGYHLLDFKR